MPPITTIASSSPENGTEIGSAEAKRWLKTESDAGEAGDRGREHEGEQLVAVGRVADEAGALLVLADRDQHVPTGERWKRQSRHSDREADRGHEPVVGPRAAEIDAEHDAGAMTPPSPFSPPVTVGPAERDGIQHRGERERQQREIDAAPAQDQQAAASAKSDDRRARTSAGMTKSPGNQWRCDSAGRIGRQAEQRAVAERDEARCGRPGCSAPCRRWRR